MIALQSALQQLKPLSSFRIEVVGQNERTEVVEHEIFHVAMRIIRACHTIERSSVHTSLTLERTANNPQRLLLQ